MEITATISSFLTHVKVEKGLSTNTVAAYKRDLTKFEEFARKRKLALESVTRDDLVDFLAGLYRLNLESRTVARKNPSSLVTCTILARSDPSTSTLIFPSGNFTLCTILASVPTW